MTSGLILFGLLLLSGFFSGTEIALFSLTREKLLVEQQRAPSAWLSRVEHFLTNPHRTLVLILLCNNVVNILASSLATVTALSVAQGVGVGISESAVLAIVTGLMTFAILLFGEITPKALAHKHALPFSLAAARVLWPLSIVLAWLVGPLSKFTEKLVGAQEMSALSEDEIKAAVALSEQVGDIDQAERKLVEKVLEFDDYRVDAVMTPRSQVFSLALATPLTEAMPQIISHKFSRMPIWGTAVDDAEAVITLHSLLQHVHEQGLDGTVADVPSTPALRVPPSMHINEVLRLLQAERTSHMALVISADGELSGVITMEDILEEIFGEIHDETDEARSIVQRQSQGKYIVRADAELEQIEEILCQEIDTLTPEDTPWARAVENNNLRHWLVEQWQTLPERGQTLTRESGTWKFVFTADRVDNQKLLSVDLQVVALAAPLVS